MDFLVTVDTSLVHLSGALGKTTKLLLPYAPDFRWLLNSEITPWYKSVQLIRQNKRMDWDNSISKIFNDKFIT
jgi:ADP-heptose:LPS heptosyltransferase